MRLATWAEPLTRSTTPTVAAQADRVEWTVRRAVPDDAAELARINVAAWRSAYRGIVPDEFLDKMDAARREQGWRRWVSLPEPDAVFVAAGGAEGRLVAYSGVTAVREEKDRHPSLPTAELSVIYADPMVWGAGAGHAVHEAAVAAMARFGFGHAVLWVFVDNAVARAFYQRHGWTCDGVLEEFEAGGHPLVEVRYSRGL